MVNVQEARNKDAESTLLEALQMLRLYKPDDRSELARRYAVTITEMEKVVAYFKTYCRGED